MSKVVQKGTPREDPRTVWRALNCVRGLKNRVSHNFGGFLENVVLLSSCLKAGVRAVRFVYLFSTLQAPKSRSNGIHC